MSMRIHTIVTHLRPDDAHTLIEFLDQLRAVLMQTYGPDIEAMAAAVLHAIRLTLRWQSGQGWKML